MDTIFPYAVVRRLPPAPQAPLPPVPGLLPCSCFDTRWSPVVSPMRAQPHAHLVCFDVCCRSKCLDHLCCHLCLALAHMGAPEQKLPVEVAGLNCVQINLCTTQADMLRCLHVPCTFFPPLFSLENPTSLLRRTWCGHRQTPAGREADHGVCIQPSSSHETPHATALPSLKGQQDAPGRAMHRRSC